MKRKLGEYFDAGVRLVWLVDPRKQTVRVHTSVEHSVVLKEGQSLDGGDVLPGFACRWKNSSPSKYRDSRPAVPLGRLAAAICRERPKDEA